MDTLQLYRSIALGIGQFTQNMYLKLAIMAERKLHMNKLSFKRHSLFHVVFGAR